MMLVIISLLLFAVGLVAIALQNTAIVAIRFLFWTMNGSMAVFIVGAFSLGLIAGLFLAIPNLIKKSLKLSGQSKNLTNLKKELTQKESLKPAEEEPNG